MSESTLPIVDGPPNDACGDAFLAPVAESTHGSAEHHKDTPPVINWSCSWYEILGVSRNAQAATIKAAYKRLSALCHPDRASAEHTATMQRINHISSILSSPATRKAYNKNPEDFPFPGDTWQADADAPTEEAAAGHPDCSARGDASNDEPTLDQTFTLRWEPVNVTAVEKALMLAAIRSVRMEHYDCFEILLSIRNRVVKVRRGTGMSAVIERTSQPVGNLQNRVHSGIKGIDPINLPGAIRAGLERGVPAALAGLSVFAFCKAIRYLCRSVLGVTEIVIVNALYSILCDKIGSVPAAVLRYRNDRDQILHDVRAWLERKAKTPVTRDAVKGLFISLGFGGTA